MSIITELITSKDQYDDFGYGTLNYDNRVIYTQHVLCEAHIPIAIKLDNDATPNISDFLSHEINEIISSDKKFSIKYKILVKEQCIDSVPIFENIESLPSDPDYPRMKQNTIGYEEKERLKFDWKEIKDLSELTIKKDEFIIIDICGNKSAQLGKYEVDIIPTLKISDSESITLDQYAWWSGDWAYKKLVTISGPTASYQMKLSIGHHTGHGSVNCNSHCNNDFSDLRFTNGVETIELDYWLETHTSGEVATFWIETNGDSTLYMYYGHADAPTTSNGTNTFIFFDDFLGSSLDLSKWDDYGSHVTNGYVEFTGGGNKYIFGKSDQVSKPDRAGRARIITAHSGESNFGYEEVRFLQATQQICFWASYLGSVQPPCFDTYIGHDHYLPVSWTKSAWGTIDACRNGTTSVICFTNDGIPGSFTGTQVPTNNGKLAILGYSHSAAYLACDWILIRKYQSTEPSFTGFGSEESQNLPPNVPSNPSPINGAIDQSINVDLGWTGGDPDPGDTVTYDVYFEKDDPTPDVLVSDDQSGTTFDPGTLEYSTHYYWQIIAKDNNGVTTPGPVWDFFTEDAPTPLTKKAFINKITSCYMPAH